MAVEYDWDSVEDQAVAKMRETLPERPPESFITRAQKARTGVKQDNGDLYHAGRYTFPEGTPSEVVDEFIRLMKNTGKYLTPVGTVLATIDPLKSKDDEGRRTVGWYAGDARGGSNR